MLHKKCTRASLSLPLTIWSARRKGILHYFQTEEVTTKYCIEAFGREWGVFFFLQFNSKFSMCNTMSRFFLWSHEKFGFCKNNWQTLNRNSNQHQLDGSKFFPLILNCDITIFRKNFWPFYSGATEGIFCKKKK